MHNDSRSLAQLWNMSRQVDDLVHRGLRTPYDVLWLLQYVNDHKDFKGRFLRGRHAEAEFTIVAEFDLEVDYSLTPQQVVEQLKIPEVESQYYHYVGTPPTPGTSLKRLVIIDLKGDDFLLFDEWLTTSGFTGSGAWVAAAYVKAYPRWCPKLRKINFMPDAATQWWSLNPSHLREPIPMSQVTVRNFDKKAPEENQGHMWNELYPIKGRTERIALLRIEDQPPPLSDAPLPDTTL